MTKRGDAPGKSSSGDFALSRSASKIGAIDIFVLILTYVFGELGFFLFVFGEASQGRKYVCNVPNKRIQMTTGAVSFQHLANERYPTFIRGSTTLRLAGLWEAMASRNSEKEADQCPARCLRV